MVVLILFVCIIYIEVIEILEKVKFCSLIDFLCFVNLFVIDILCVVMVWMFFYRSGVWCLMRNR